MSEEVRELMFINSDASPKISAVHVSTASISAVMAWYGGYFAGDRYRVQVDGKLIEKDRNGELVGAIPPKDATP